MNSKLSDIQKQAIENWDGETVLTITPNGNVMNSNVDDAMRSSSEAVRFLEAMSRLDELGVPRYDALDGREYSIVNRIDWLMRNAKQFS